jgi:hypothetical protein
MIKKGISKVFVIVLLILMIIAAIVILWTIISPILIKDLNIQIVDLKIAKEDYTAWDSVNRLAEIQVSRGADGTEIIGFDLIFLFESGITIVHYVNENIEQNSKKVYRINFSNFDEGDLKVVRIAPVFKNERRGEITDEILINTATKDLQIVDKMFIEPNQGSPTGSKKDSACVNQCDPEIKCEGNTPIASCTLEDNCYIKTLSLECTTGTSCNPLTGNCDVNVCIPNTEHKCFSGHLYWYNNCGERGEKKEDCGSSGCLDNRCLFPDYFFYVDGQSGSDSNEGSLASPFKTIQKCADIVQPGEVCMIRKGTYRETIIPKNSGTKGKEIVFLSYPGETVVVSGAEIISNWQLHSGNIYKANMGWDMGRGKNQVYVDGKAMMTAMHPNAPSVMKPNFFSIDQNSSWWGGYQKWKGEIYSSNLGEPEGYWNGAIWHGIWSPHYHAGTGLVTKYTKGKLEIDITTHPLTTNISKSGRFYLIDHLNALDTEEEFYYDYAGTLYLWATGGKNPSTLNVEAKKREIAFNLNDKSFIRIDGINIFASTIISNTNTRNIVLDNIEVKYPSHYLIIDESSVGSGLKGIRDSGVVIDGNNNIIKNSKISDSSGNGVTLLGENNTVDNCEIFNFNYVVTESAGVAMGWKGSNVKNNKVINSKIYNGGRHLLVIAYAENVSILNNEIFNNSYGRESGDLGAIYTISTDGKGSEIAYNKIYDIREIGIYIDRDSSNYNIHHNVLWGITFPRIEPRGVHCNVACTNVKIHHNTAPDSYISLNTAFTTKDTTGTEVKNNIARRIYPSSWQYGAVVENNLAISGMEIASIFTNPSSNDYRLKSGSPAINSGLYLGYTRDIEGNQIIDKPDIGAYEFQG